MIVGLVLVVAPGLYLGARYGFFGFGRVNGNPGLVDSFRASARLSAGHELTLAGAGLGLLLFNVLGASLLGLGLLVTVPMSVLISVDLWRQATR